jgi:hypothetical protein
MRRGQRMRYDEIQPAFMFHLVKMFAAVFGARHRSTQLPVRSPRRRFLGFSYSSLAPCDRRRFILEDSLQDEGAGNRSVENR